jgi:hypothetical protein
MKQITTSRHIPGTVRIHINKLCHQRALESETRQRAELFDRVRQAMAKGATLPQLLALVDELRPIE